MSHSPLPGTPRAERRRLQSSHTVETVANAATIALLLVLMVVVLMPLAWMVLTALRARGTAFLLDFTPNTEIATPPADQDALPLLVARSDERWVWVEHIDPQATEVSVVAAVLPFNADTIETTLATRLEGVETRTVPMTRSINATWVAALGPFKEPVEVAWKLSINGGAPTSPVQLVEVPANDDSAAATTTERRPADGLKEGWATARLAEPGVAQPKEPLATVYAFGDRAYAQVRAKPDRQLAVRMGDRDYPFADIAPGVFEANLPATATTGSYRLIETRPFGQALNEMYSFANFTRILTDPTFPFGWFFLNSLVVATGGGLLTVFLCTLAGYAFSQKPFHYRETIFRCLLASMLIPGMIFMVPQFSITIRLGLMDTYAGMIVPHLANVFGLFLLRQYIDQIPKDLFAAAEIDGANEPQIFQTVVIPVCLPIMVTLFLLTFVTQWSNFLWQLIINTGESTVLTLPIGLQLFRGQNANEWEMIMAGACFSILPISVLFLALQRFFLEGLTAGSVKE